MTTSAAVLVVSAIAMTNVSLPSTAEATAEQVIAVMKRVMDVDFPPKPPAMRLRRLTKHERAAVAAMYQDDREHLPMWEFLDPITLEQVDKTVFREVAGVWSRNPQDLLQAVPRLVSHYDSADGVLKEMILETAIRFTDQASGSERDVIQQVVFLRILDRAPDLDVRLKCLYQSEGCGKTEDTYRHLVDYSRSIASVSCDECVGSVAALRGCPLYGYKRPEFVNRYLLQIVTDSRYCERCRVKSIDKGSIGGLEPGEVLAHYTKIVEADESEELTRLIMVNVLQAEDEVSREELLRLLAAALHSKSESSQIDALEALQRVTGEVGEEVVERLFGKRLLGESLSDEEREELASTVQRWRVRLGEELNH